MVLHRKPAKAFNDLAERLGIQWKRNALRHSYISYRLAIVPDTARIALECGNSPGVIFTNYRELTTPEQAKEWFSIVPADKSRIGRPMQKRYKDHLLRRNTKAVLT